MDNQNYVGQSGNGFVVVIGGQQVGTYPDQASAEAAFNASGGGGAPAADTTTYPDPLGRGSLTVAQMTAKLQEAGYNGPWDDASVIAAYNRTASGVAPAPATGTGSAAQNLLDAIASGDAAKFDEAIREFNVTSGENQRQFDATQTQQQGQFDTTSGERSREFDVTSGQTDRKLYSDLATALLNTAAQLRGPKDYYQFQQMTSGGRDLMTQLYGNQPRPDFSAPTGKIEPETIADLMAKLGFTTAPGTGTPASTPPPSGTPAPATGGAPAGSYNTVNGVKTVDQMYQELHTAGWGGQATDTAGIVAAYASTTKNPVTPGTGAPAPAPAPAATVPPVQAVTPSVTPTNGAVGTQGAVLPFTGTPASQMPQVASGSGGLSWANPPNIGGAQQGPVTPVSNPVSGQAPAASGANGMSWGGQQSVVPPVHAVTPPVTPLAGVKAAITPPAPTPVATTGWNTPSQNGVTPVSNPVSGNAPVVSGANGMSWNTTPAAPAGPTAQAPVNRAPMPWDTTPKVPLPFQINPAVWDALGSVGQDLALSAAEAAGWDKNEYLRQLNMSRPQGTAPHASVTAYGSPMSAFGGGR